MTIRFIFIQIFPVIALLPGAAREILVLDAGGQNEIGSQTGSSFLSVGAGVSEVAGCESSPGGWDLAAHC